MKQSNQFIMHTIDLIEEFHPTIAELSLTLLLLVPVENIATDIISGFPSLMQQERDAINDYILDTMINFQENSAIQNLRPLVYADKLVQEIEKDTKEYFHKHPRIELMSASVSIQTDIIQTLPIKEKKRKN